MRPLRKGDAPAFLQSNAEKWAQQWKSRREKDPAAQWSWYQHEGKKVNHLVIPLLKKATANHCSYCDCNEIGESEESIDHFRPKSDPRFSHLSYAWENLYYVCANCQKSKMETWRDELPLLAPDESGFSFWYYFDYESRTGLIQPNPDRTQEEQARAEYTIETLGLRDEQKHCLGRRRAYKAFEGGSFEALDDLPYRYLFSL